MFIVYNVYWLIMLSELCCSNGISNTSHVERATGINTCTGINGEKEDVASRHPSGSLTPRIFQSSKHLRSHVFDIICICTPVSQVAIACFHKFYSCCRALLRFVKARYRLCHISLDIWKPCMDVV